MKSKRQKVIEYEQKYCTIPKNYIDRLNWMYDNFNIDDNFLYSINGIPNKKQLYQKSKN